MMNPTIPDEQPDPVADSTVAEAIVGSTEPIDGDEVIPADAPVIDVDAADAEAVRS